MMKANKGILQAILSIFALSVAHGMAIDHNGGGSGKYRNRMSLGGLPPRWKGKRQARIMRGGR
jgi:hypothetical protein